MQHLVVTDAYLVGNLVGFTAGLAITFLLLALVIRARSLPSTSYAHFLLVGCALAWNSAGLARTLVLASSPHYAQTLPLLSALQFTGAAIWPVPLLSLWRPLAAHVSQRRGAAFLLTVAIADAIVIVGALWAEALTGYHVTSPLVVKELTSFNGSLLALGAVVWLARRPYPRKMWFSPLMTLAGVCGTTAGVILVNAISLRPSVAAVVLVVSEQSTLLILLGAFFMFATFRFADLFIRYSLRIVLAATLTVTLVMVWQTDIVARLADQAAFPWAVRIFAICLQTIVLIAVFARLVPHLDTFVSRGIVGMPDYRSAIQGFRHRLAELHTDREIFAITCAAIGDVLQIDDVRMLPADRLPAGTWSTKLRDGDIVELDVRSSHELPNALRYVELIVPTRFANAGNVALGMSLGPVRRGLVTHEIEYLRALAAECNARADALRLERETLERHNREAVLKQQLTEAELRALRAQINPHFLFNALNTLADLIVTNPIAAEAMTLRLAKVFRHLLAQSGRSLTPIGDEIDFLRAYLQIEEARFGGRLRVNIDVPPQIARYPIPSLILQPVVENALKHGLAPKIGVGHIWVSAREQDDRLCLEVEDDGIGMGRANAGRSTGVGLANTARRLAVAYDGHATLALAPRAAGGTHVTITVPRSSEAPGEV